ncbi:calcium-binding protein [Streptomyces sp. NBC_00445]|uniref:calcium-binding protein n=1 Tax=unclassified Streptomyces TaxID=2593676 RepID=UPI002E21BB23|nr:MULTISPECIES: calcium-binding protein [unclassified Streptomyces]
MRIYSAAVATCGVIALSALAVPAAQADEQFGDTDITSVVVNSGAPVVVGTSARTVTVEVTATDPTGFDTINATLYHGSYATQDATVASTGACGPTTAATSTCALTFHLAPGTAPADDALAGSWSVSAFAIASDGDAEFLDSAATFSLRRETRLTVDATPEPVKWGKVLTVKGGMQNADWANGTNVAAEAGRPVALQFRQKGCATYSTVKTVKTAADGTLSTTVRAYSDGDYRWSYAGTDTTAAAVSEGDFVDVR